MRLRPLTMLAILGALGACREPAREVPAESLPAGTVVLTPAQRQTARLATDTVRLTRVATPLVVPATLHAPDLSSARVGSIVEGRVDAVRVLPGDRVEAGAPLMLIHSHELATAVRDYSSAEAELAVAQAAYDRSARLFADEAVPKEEVERRRALVEQARAEFRRAREIVDHLSPSPQGDVTVRAPDDAVLIVSGQGPDSSNIVFLFDTADPEAEPRLETAFASQMWSSGGLHRAHDENRFAWCDKTAEGGTIYSIEAN